MDLNQGRTPLGSSPSFGPATITNQPSRGEGLEVSSPREKSKKATTLKEKLN
jgi:hypothetical protein